MKRVLTIQSLFQWSISILLMPQVSSKLGPPIILLCNGTCLHVEHLGGRVIKACILGGFHSGKVAFIPRMTLTPSYLGKNSNMYLTLCVRGVELCFCHGTASPFPFSSLSSSLLHPSPPPPASDSI